MFIRENILKAQLTVRMLIQNALYSITKAMKNNIEERTLRTKSGVHCVVISGVICNQYVAEGLFKNYIRTIFFSG